MSESDHAAASGDRLFGLELSPLPEGCTPIEAIAIIKCLDPDGDICVFTRATDGLSVWDRVGLLTITVDRARADAAACFSTRPVDSEDED